MIDPYLRFLAGRRPTIPGIPGVHNLHHDLEGDGEPSLARFRTLYVDKIELEVKE